jgi:hypothetical protein
MPAGEQPPGGNSAPRMAHLPERGKKPASARVLDTWINQAQDKLGMDAGRLGWLIASTVVVAALQRAVDETGRSLFPATSRTCSRHLDSGTSVCPIRTSSWAFTGLIGTQPDATGAAGSPERKRRGESPLGPTEANWTATVLLIMRLWVYAFRGSEWVAPPATSAPHPSDPIPGSAHLRTHQ